VISNRIFSTLSLVALAVTVACGDDGPTAPARAVVPTPIPEPSLSGSWRGSFRECPAFDPCRPSVSATATLVHEGSQVQGVLSVEDGRFPEITVNAAFRGGQLTGTVIVNGVRRNLTGSASALRVTLNFQTSSISGAAVDLHRS
jgi:hypothetical protein